MIRLLFSVLLLVSPCVATGLTYNVDLKKFDQFDEVKIFINDDVNGGCWTNLKEVREYSEEKVKMSGMTLNDNGYHHYTFVVNAIGRRSGGMCEGHITVGLYSSIELEEDLVGLVTVKEIGYNFRDVSFNSIVLDNVGRFFSPD